MDPLRVYYSNSPVPESLCYLVIELWIPKPSLNGLSFQNTTASCSGRSRCAEPMNAMARRRCSFVALFLAMPCIVLSLNAQATIPILWQNPNLLVLDKPPGIPHHTEGPDTPGVLEILRHQRRLEEERLYGVHRLDKVTSGILLVAKNRETAQSLTRAFRDKTIVKYYLGLSRHKLGPQKQGWVRGWMKRGRRGAWMLSREETPLDCRTRYYSAKLGDVPPLERGPSPQTLLLFRPYTGRTHQLRVAAKSIGLPLMGDPSYPDRFVEKADRTYLHAAAMYVPPGLVSEDGVCLWSPSRFDSLWPTEEQRSLYKTKSRRLLEKGCDCAPLQDHILAAQQATRPID